MKKCKCPNGPNVMEITRVHGMTGQYCGNPDCMAVLNYDKVVEEKPVKEKPVKEPKAESVAKKEIPKASIAKMEVAKKEPVVENSGWFQIHMIQPVKDTPTTIDLTLIFNREEGIGFMVPVQNDAEAIAKVLANPDLLRGSYAKIKYTKIDKSGVPVDGVMVGKMSAEEYELQLKSKVV